jgi:DNA polymerase
LLAEAGIDRAQISVTNAVKHFKWTPRGERRLHARPQAGEVQACRAWLDAEIEAVRPTVIVCLGSTAARSFLGPRFNAARGRGKLHRTPWAPVWLATYHPSAALRSLTPADRERALAGLRDDLRLAAAQLQLHTLNGPVEPPAPPTASAGR